MVLPIERCNMNVHKVYYVNLFVFTMLMIPNDDHFIGVLLRIHVLACMNASHTTDVHPWLVNINKKAFLLLLHCHTQEKWALNECHT